MSFSEVFEALDQFYATEEGAWAKEACEIAEEAGKVYDEAMKVLYMPKVEIITSDSSRPLEGEPCG